jgi:hypothetical protein
MKKQKAADDQVGKGSPPAATRWKKGDSGNPNGRPIRVDTLESLLQKVFHRRKATVLKGGKPVRVSLSQALIDKYVDAALKGNWKIAEFLLKVYYENRAQVNRTRSERLTPRMLQKRMEVYKESLETRPDIQKKSVGAVKLPSE